LGAVLCLGVIAAVWVIGAAPWPNPCC
jgi:hypothetical protein